MRLDRALVARGLVRSRGRAHDVIDAGSVYVDGAPVRKASADVREDQDVVVIGEGDVYVSRAAHKLLGALDAFAPHGLEVDGRRCLDAGVSTGGFTQVLLERGASHVLALDVGHGQTAPVVEDDPRVTLREGINVRDLPPPAESGVGLVVADLSFISLTLVVGALAPWVEPGGDALLLVKPQFEVGAGRAKGGIVRDPRLKAEAVEAVARAAESAGLTVAGVRRSVVSGADGNVEFFLWGAKTWQAKGATDTRPRLDGEALDLEISREVHEPA
jgi:23S rRNA (cytidine1920-2'-O)/16S rRNA (cytidine1409-2'-O)-methyltransferase